MLPKTRLIAKNVGFAYGTILTIRLGLYYWFVEVETQEGRTSKRLSTRELNTLEDVVNFIQVMHDKGTLTWMGDGPINALPEPEALPMVAKPNPASRKPARRKP
jgi:hypothetical protein